MNKKLIAYIAVLILGAVSSYSDLLPQMTAVSIVLLVGGFYLLINGADYFVDGSASLARKLRIPSLIVGLTIVAMGTSAPELAVSISAALSGSNAIAISNVIGSNIFNTLVVLGVCAAIMPIMINKEVTKRDYPVSLLASIMFIVFILDGTLARWEAAVLFVCLIAYIVVSVIQAKKGQSDDDEPMGDFSALKCALCIVGGVAGIVLGGNLVVDHAKAIAMTAGMSDTLVGLTICAVGTSLPELVTSITASKKGENDMAVGNVVGSNIFNIFGILGISGIITPIAVDLTAVIDGVVLLAIGIISYVWYRTSQKLSRIEGIAMVIMYVEYMVYIIIRNYS